MIYIILILLSFILTYYIKKIAIRKSLVDIPNDRSSHTTPTPHGGGIAIAVSWFIGISYLYYINDINSSLFFALLTGVVISAVSYIDDLYELSAKVRLLTQASVALVGLYFLGGLQTIDLMSFSIEDQVVTNIFAFLTVIWFINLYNFLDGIDGYAGSEAVFLGIAGFLLFGGSHFLVLVFAVLGFLVWNWHKAKIFMGDVGSTLLGYNVAIFTIYYANQEQSNLWMWITMFGLFWFDATLTLVRRYKNGEKLGQAHRKHGYQRLVQSGWAHDKVVIFSILVNFSLFCLVYFISNILIAFFISLLVLYAVMRYIDNKKSFN
ncbi:glycosyl transferase, group 4 family protein [Sulfurimonas gotlandica GD1]|uniref:Glycosyl transferase, group 4 family protein n=1 Tax=Sulfurimonas gotlandica (strain DSM 19862 / JCM 16533 / GD1) TaxID=929558 RepID=B6BKD8_SULGG|nr:glycosyltransferase family 4 protein [Sulfurimonas gotlandica]EDZ62422.1 glycosyl transferase, group 4 family protein [Sulfurimonas gotlandica GD1]EHP28993.1 glycosyl transferase, group 4 family protein [Sulfurimonas gotlandica GD1]